MNQVDDDQTISAATPNRGDQSPRMRLDVHSPSDIDLPRRSALWLAGSRANALVLFFALCPVIYGLQQPADGAFEHAAWTRIRDALGLASDAADPNVAPLSTIVVDEADNRPWTADEFVANVVGLPAPAVRIHYDIVLLQTHRGALDMWLCRDGSRAMTWQLGSSATPPSATTLAQHSVVADHRGIWSDVAAEQALTWAFLLNSSAHAVSTLAQTYATLDPTSQQEIGIGILNWRDELLRARAEEPGRTDIVAQQSCVLSQWASQTICVWEEVGAVLRYEGPRFAVTATLVHFIDDPIDAHDACSPRDTLQRVLTWNDRIGEANSAALSSADTELHLVGANAGDERESFGHFARQSLEALALGNYAPFALLLAGQPLSVLGTEDTRERPL